MGKQSKANAFSSEMMLDSYHELTRDTKMHIGQ